MLFQLRLHTLSFNQATGNHLKLPTIFSILSRTLLHLKDSLSLKLYILGGVKLDIEHSTLHNQLHSKE